MQLIETSDPNGGLAVQSCAGGVDNRDCTINPQKIMVGQTLTGARKGIVRGPFDPAVRITYRVS